MRNEGGEDSGEFRIDLERVIVDPDYRRRVLARLRVADGDATEAVAAAAPVNEG